MDKPKCSRCGKIIVGNVKVGVFRKKLGKKHNNVTEYYDEECFKKINLEQAIDEHKKQKAINKGKCCS